jgi:hypothetical protein
MFRNYLLQTDSKQFNWYVLPMSKRLAITISGAVSLGSYEVGVLYEICEALRQHNEDSETIANPADRIEIDVHIRSLRVS